MKYSFGAFDLDTDLFELRRAGVPVALEPQVFNVLTYLLEHRDRVVPKNDLLDNVWGDRFVSESALTTRIKAARRAVGDDGQQQRVIRTVHGRGYRFVADVRVGEIQTASPTPAAESAADPSATRWPMVGRMRELERLARWMRDESTDGVLLTGSAGVGKTRLAEACLELADAAGLPSARVTGHCEGRSIPFAAFAHLLPEDVATGGTDELDRARVFHRARAALRAQAGDERLALLIDDGDQLDELSRALVTSLVQSHTVFAIITMRTEGGPTPFDHLVKDGHVLRLGVEPLPTDSVEILLQRVLGGAIVGESLQRFADAAMGNPGVLRQLVDAASDAGALTCRDGVWRLSGPLQPTPSFEGLVSERLSGLDEEHRHAAELLAISGEIALDGLASVVRDGVLEDLEHRGMLTVRASGRRHIVALAHPLFAEVLVRKLPALRGRRLRRQLADAIEGVRARRRDDKVRLVAWRLDGGGDLDSDLVLNTAALALLEGDDAIAERLIRRALAGGAAPRAVELLAELHFRRNEPEQVEAALAGIDLTAMSDHERMRIVRRRSGNRYYGLTDPHGALAVLDEGEPLLHEPRSVQAAHAQRATILSMEGLIDDALVCTEPLMRTTTGTVRFETLRARALALAGAGRGEEALALVDEADALHDEFDDDLGRPGRSIVLFTELFALTELGRLEEARAVGAQAAAAGPVGGRASWLAFARPRIELLAGNAAAALALSQPHAIETRARGSFGAERWVLSLVGMARLLGGDLEGGTRDVQRVWALWRQDYGMFRSDRDRAFAWLSAELDGLPAARDILLAGALDAHARGAHALEAMLLHDIVRFGGAPLVCDRLVALAEQLQGDLITARAHHAAGAASGDTGRLREAATMFQWAGSPLLAAEAMLDVAEAADSKGNPAASDAIDDAERLLARLDHPVVTPRLRGLLPDAVPPSESVPER